MPFIPGADWLSILCVLLAISLGGVALVVGLYATVWKRKGAALVIPAVFVSSAKYLAMGFALAIALESLFPIRQRVLLMNPSAQERQCELDGIRHAIPAGHSSDIKLRAFLLSSGQPMLRFSGSENALGPGLWAVNLTTATRLSCRTVQYEDTVLAEHWPFENEKRPVEPGGVLLLTANPWAVVFLPGEYAPQTVMLRDGEQMGECFELTVSDAP